MNNYIVTNIRIPEEDYLRLKQEAAIKRTSLSAIIREKIGKKKTPQDYAKKLLSIESTWFSPKEIEKNKTEVGVRTKKNTL